MFSFNFIGTFLLCNDLCSFAIWHTAFSWQGELFVVVVVTGVNDFKMHGRNPQQWESWH